MAYDVDNSVVKRSFPDVDLRLIDAIWDVQKRTGDDIRPSDRRTIRQTMAAAERLGGRLIAMLGEERTMSCRVLPLFTRTTRVSKAPKRIWLEFTDNKAVTADGTSPVLFLEFTRKKVNFGLYVPGFSSDSLRRETWSTFRYENPQVFRGLKQKRRAKGTMIDDVGVLPEAWFLSKKRPPSDVRHCSSDKSDWLKDLSEGTETRGAAVSISLAFKKADLAFAQFVTCLAEAIVIFAPFLEIDGGSEAEPLPEKGDPGRDGGLSAGNVFHFS